MFKLRITFFQINHYVMEARTTNKYAPRKLRRNIIIHNDSN